MGMGGGGGGGGKPPLRFVAEAQDAGVEKTALPVLVEALSGAGTADGNKP